MKAIKCDCCSEYSDHDYSGITFTNNIIPNHIKSLKGLYCRVTGVRHDNSQTEVNLCAKCLGKALEELVRNLEVK